MGTYTEKAIKQLEHEIEQLGYGIESVEKVIEEKKEMIKELEASAKKHKWKVINNGNYWTEEQCKNCKMKWVSQWEDIKHYPEGGLTPIYGCTI